MKSIISFPDRGKWGSASWRGNCSGHIQRELIEHFNPKLFVDICEGSGTSRDVCRVLGVDYKGFDLHTGTDFTSDYILSLLPGPADLVFSHPPYADMIDYGAIGEFKDPKLVSRDLSRCNSVDEFLEKSYLMLLNQREATKAGGIYSCLIGDMRQKGTFRSFQSDYIQMMPKSELISVTIKYQHNCVSDATKYSGSFIPIMHEYLLVWKKSKATTVKVAMDHLREIKQETSITWRTIIRMALIKLGGRAKLDDIYRMVEKDADDRIALNQNWMAKIRQTLQQHFESVERGVWAVPAEAA